MYFSRACCGISIGVVAWLAWGNVHDVLELVHLSVLCLAAASGVWTAIEPLVPRGVPHLLGERRPVVFAHLAAAVGLTVMALLAAHGVFCNLESLPHAAVTRLAWIALAAVAASLAFTLWDRTARLSLGGLYLAGLTVLAMFWGSLPPGPRRSFAGRPPPSCPHSCWRPPCSVGGWEKASASGNGSASLASPSAGLPAGSWACKRFSPRWRPGWPFGYPFDFAFDGVGRDMLLLNFTGRMAGGAGAAMLFGATVLMVGQSEQQWRRRWQYAALAAGLLLMSCGGWAVLDPTAGMRDCPDFRVSENGTVPFGPPSFPVGQAPWLHRSVVLLVAATMMILVSGFGLAKLLPKTSDWIAAGRRAAPHFGGLRSPR